LLDAFTRVKFEGYAEWRGLLEFNKDYWQVIPGLPELITYGAIFGTASLGLVYRKQKNAA